jgi:signal transduction histidine kinase
MVKSTLNRPNELNIRLPLWRQFRFNLIFAFVILAVLPLIIVAVLTTSQQIAQVQQQTVQQLESIVELKNGQIDIWLNEALVAFDYILVNVNFRQFLASTVIDHHNIPVETLNVLNGTIKDLIEANPYFERFIVYSADGEIVLASTDTDLGKLVRLQPYFTPSLNEETFIQPPFFDLSTTQLTVMITRQIQNEAGQIVGIFAGQTNLDILGDIMTERTGLGETGETYLVSRQNNYLLTPSHFEGYELARTYNSEAIANGLQRRSGNSIYENYQSPSQRVVGVYRWIPQLEAVLIAEVNEGQVLTGVQQSQINIVMLGLVAAILALSGGLFYANRISLPIIRLANTANQFAEGNLGARSDIKSRNEVGVLANTFNAMAQGIEERQTELTNLNQNLERRVAERTSDLKEARDEALTAQRIATENSRLKSEFLSTMSHELRTPLNAIEGFTSIMLSGMGVELSPRAEEMIKRVSSNSKRLLQLINDFLDLSRIEAGRLELVKAPVSPKVLAQKWQNQVGILGEEKGLEFIVTIAPDLPDIILSDEDALSKIALNLLGNAFKFTHQGKVSLDIKRLDNNWKIVVSDTGIGIPSHAREYIFEEFRQVDGSSKRLYGGTGLGL